MISAFAVVAVLAAQAPFGEQSGRALDIVFLPDAPAAPPLVISIENNGKKRAMTWTFAGGTAISGALSDEQGSARAVLPLPGAPRGAALVDRGGGVSVTVDDAGAWQDALKVVPPARVEALPVAGPRGLRLVVHGAPNGPNGAAAPAVLYGSDVRISGRALLRTDRAPLTAFVVAGNEVFAQAGTSVSDVEGCGRSVPAAVSVVGAQSLKLTASGPAMCAGGLAIVPVTGTKLDAKKDIPATGVVVARERGSP